MDGEDKPLALSKFQSRGIWRAKGLRLVMVEGFAVLALGVTPEWERLNL
jgi:hypothetical protein